jgi:hypothetical protein
MVIAKTSANANENHSAQRIVTSPLHSESACRDSRSRARDKHSAGQLTSTLPRWGYRLDAGMPFQRGIIPTTPGVFQT